MNRILPLVILGAALSLGLTACASERGGSSEKRVGATPSATATGTPTPVLGANFSVHRIIDARVESEKPKEGGAYQTLSVTTNPRQESYGPQAETSYGWLALGLDGSLVATQDQPPVEPGIGLLGATHLGTWSTGEFERLDYSNPRPDNTQITAASLRDDRVAWVETTSTDLDTFPWTVYSGVVGEPGRRSLGSSDVLISTSPPPPVHGSVRPSFGGDFVYWATTYPLGQKVGSQIRGADPDTGAPAPGTPILGAVMPVGTADSVFYVRGPLFAPTKGKAWTIVRRDTATGGEQSVVSMNLGRRTITAISASERHLAWVVGEGRGSATLYLRDLRDSRTIAFRLENRGPPMEDLGVSDDFLVWSSSTGDSGQYVYDIESGRVWRPHEQPEFGGVMVAGRIVAWAALPTEGFGAATWTITRW